LRTVPALEEILKTKNLAGNCGAVFIFSAVVSSRVKISKQFHLEARHRQPQQHALRVRGQHR
jgi:hypothetical protein